MGPFMAYAFLDRYVVKPKGGQAMGGFANPAITEGYCTDIYDRWNPSLEPLKEMSKCMDSGACLLCVCIYPVKVGPYLGLCWVYS